MAGILSVADAAKLLGVTDRRVRVLREGGRIPGAQKVGGVWVLPADLKVTKTEGTRPGKIQLTVPKKRGRPRKALIAE